MGGRADLDRLFAIGGDRAAPSELFNEGVGRLRQVAAIVSGLVLLACVVLMVIWLGGVAASFFRPLPLLVEGACLSSGADSAQSDLALRGAIVDCGSGTAHYDVTAIFRAGARASCPPGSTHQVAIAGRVPDPAPTFVCLRKRN